jgi:hypothetical protein
VNDRYEQIAEKLAAIEEELRDLAYDRLSDAARDPDGRHGAGAAAEEKRLLQARRAVAKAIQVLSRESTSGD